MAVGEGFQSEEAPSGAMRPLSFGQTLAAAWRLTTTDLGTLVAVSLACALPAAIIGIVLLAITMPAGAQLIGGKLYLPIGESATAVSLMADLRSLIDGVFSLISAGAMYRILLGRYLQRPAGFTAGIGYAVERFVGLLVLSILVAIVVIIGMILFVVPGIWAAVALSMAVPALMTQRISPLRAMGWSLSLVERHWWFVFVRLLIPTVLVGAISYVVMLVLTPALASNSLTMLVLLPALASLILGPLLGIYLAAVSAVVFADLNVRKGWTTPQQIAPNW